MIALCEQHEAKLRKTAVVPAEVCAVCRLKFERDCLVALVAEMAGAVDALGDALNAVDPANKAFASEAVQRILAGAAKTRAGVTQ